MKLPSEYQTENSKMNALIAKALAKEGKLKSVSLVDYPKEERAGRFQVSKKEDRTSTNNIVFDSKQELERYQELLLLQQAGQISGLELQKSFVLVPDFLSKGEKVRGVTYRADFYYLEHDTPIIEELKVKATRTKDYIIKSKLMRWMYPEIDFREVVKDK
jgi:hypothetical protein